jgi:DNA-binding NarL/FixJ family response regulator
VDECRRERVRELLAQGMAKKTISVELGFSHATAFSRWLQRNQL